MEGMFQCEETKIPCMEYTFQYIEMVNLGKGLALPCIEMDFPAWMIYSLTLKHIVHTWRGHSDGTDEDVRAI
jgi:hypothetical protein